MPESVFVDTGYLLALLADDDKLHGVAMAWRRKVAERRLRFVPISAILLEVGDAFRLPQIWPKAEAVIAAMEVHPDITIVEVDRVLLKRARDVKSTYRDKEWGLTDCTSFVIMWDLGMTRALSFDKHFEQAGFRALLKE